MRAMPRAWRRPEIPVTGAPVDPESWHPLAPAATRGIARMARSYGSPGRCVEGSCRPEPQANTFSWSSSSAPASEGGGALPPLLPIWAEIAAAEACSACMQRARASGHRICM